MRLGLFGGSFDPVHYGHLLLAECCREQCELGRVLFVPTATPPHKKGRPLAPADDRVAMLRLAIAGQEAFEVCAHEIERGGTSYTVETLRHFRQTRPDDELFLMVGADMLNDLPNWREAAEICRLAQPVAVHRPGTGPIDFACLEPIASPERIAQTRRLQVEMPEMGMSSTDLRRRAADGRSIRYQTPRAVEEYIRTQGLYGAGDSG
ncbi:MAG TPA: nicotinate (nicotinamide) nucleotide adenylyltransferase [Planctomycetaceae bacterium]|nr:nicotinate (nicotinamide) nucleotide adenylyltransferase [Planctomycetaceae bacterium]